MSLVIIENRNQEFDAALNHFSDECGTIRTGRANPLMVEHLIVEYYGAKTPLIQMASITIPEPRMIMIQPWSRDSLVNIETALRNSDLGFNPSNDGIVIRITIPQLTEERRREYVKLLNQKAEEGRIAIRQIREDIWKDVQNAEKEGSISEDDKFRGKDELQKVVDEYNQKIEAIRERKEKDIMTV